MNILRVLLLRHGTTDWNVVKRLQGHVDRPLLADSAAALAQLRIPGATEVTRWLASPLVRAQETARALGAVELQIVPQLIEMDWGTWEGQTVAALRRTLGEAMRRNEARGADLRPPGGESPREVAARVTRWLGSLARPAQPERHFVAVTHKGVIRATFAHLWGWDMRGPPPHRFDWNALHEVQVWPDGQLRAGRLNIALEPRAVADEVSS